MLVVAYDDSPGDLRRLNGEGLAQGIALQFGDDALRQTRGKGLQKLFLGSVICRGFRLVAHSGKDVYRLQEGINGPPEFITMPGIHGRHGHIVNMKTCAATANASYTPD